MVAREDVLSDQIPDLGEQETMTPHNLGPVGRTKRQLNEGEVFVIPCMSFAHPLSRLTEKKISK